MTRRSALSKENCGSFAGSVARLRDTNTRCVSCATPIAATCERPDRRGVQILAHHVDVAVGGFQRHHRDVVGIGERRHWAAESVTDLLQQRRRRNPKAEMAHEQHQLSADLQLTEITMQINPVQAFDIELHVPVEHIVDRDRVDR